MSTGAKVKKAGAEAVAAESEHNIRRMLQTTWETSKNLLWYFWHFSVVLELFELFPCSNNNVCNSQEAVVMCVLLNTCIRRRICQSYDLAYWLRKGNSGIERLVQKQIVRHLSSGLNHCLYV